VSAGNGEEDQQPQGQDRVGDSGEWDRVRFFASIAAYVGLDPRKDITWVVHEVDEGLTFRGG